MITSSDELTNTVIEPKSGWIAVNWRELWDSRELLAFLIWREVAVRYKQTVLGVAWAVLQPVFSMVVFSVIFGNLAKLPSDGLPYPIFVYAGLLPWTFFSAALSGASNSLLSQQALLTKIYLPRLFVPGAAVGSCLVDLAISSVVLLAMMVYYQVPLRWDFLWVPFLVLITLLAAAGLGLALAAVVVSYRDLRYVVPFMVQVGMYLSPVIYPVTMVPEQWRWLLALNPMTGIIDGFRSSLLGKAWNYEALAMASAISVLLFVYGLFYFRKTERRFADVA